MANISFHKYLEAAFRYRLFDPKGQRATPSTSFSSFGYNLTYDRIFYYARKILPPFYRNNTEFPDDEKGNLKLAETVLYKLDKHQDSELENQFKGITTSSEENLIINQAAAESQQANRPVGATAGGMPLGGIPSAPSIAPAPRRVFVAQQTPPTSGKAGGTGQGTAATSKIERLEAEKASATVGKSNQPSAQAASPLNKPSPAQASNLRSTAPQRFNFSNIRSSVGTRIAGAARAGLERANPFLGRLGNRTLGGLGRIANPGGIGRMGGGSRSIFGRLGGFGKFGGGGGRGGASLASKAKSRSGLIFALGLIGLMFLVGILAAIGGTSNPTNGTSPTGTNPIVTNPTGAGCPDTSSNTNEATCHYLNPSINIFDKSISPSVIDSYISKYSPIFINAAKGDLTEFTKRVNYIVSNSQQAGLNPAIFLGYWKTESNFSTQGSRDLGCAGDNFYEQVDCALGINTFSDPAKNPIANCARSKDANSPACISLKSVRTSFDQVNLVKYPIATFDDFTESYGPYSHLSDDGKHTNCTHTYNELIDTAKELSACTVSSTITVTPPANGDLTQSIIDKFGINFQGPEFTTDRLQAAWEILNQAQQVAPKFFGLLGTGITVATHADTSERAGNIIYFSTRPGSFFMTGNSQQFKVLLIHELGHIIRGDPGSIQASYDQRLQSAVNKDALKNGDDGYLTGYGKNPCYGTLNIDEDFAETVTYYINKGAKEEDLGCGVKFTIGPNPLESGRYPAHLDFIQSVLGKP